MAKVSQTINTDQLMQWKICRGVEWVFIDEIRSTLGTNYHKNLFAKKINDQYHYFVSFSKPNYFDPDFASKLNNLVIITKKDYAPYKNDESIDGMFLTQYLQYKEKQCEEKQWENSELIKQFIDQDDDNDIDGYEDLSKNTNEMSEAKRIDSEREMRENNRNQFWDKYPHCGYNDDKMNITEAFDGIPQVDEIPPEYVPVSVLYKDDDEHQHEYYLYCKKIDDKYYYLLDTQMGVNTVYYNNDELDLDNNYNCQPNYKIYYYDPKFKDKLSSFIDVSKNDFTKYQTDNCILGNMHTKEYHDNQIDIKIKKRNRRDGIFGTNIGPKKILTIWETIYGIKKLWVIILQNMY